MENHKLIKELENTNSRILKEKIILDQMINNNKFFLEGLKLAYNKLLTFGVKQIPESICDGNGLSWHNFKELCNQLIARNLTGHAARDKIKEMMNKSEKDEWNYFFKRILQKDEMRCIGKNNK